MRLVLLFVLGLLVFSRIVFETGLVMADTGSGSGSGSAAAPLTSTLHDPSQAPLQSIGDAEAAFKVGWPLGVLVATFMLLELGAYVGKSKSIAWLAWLGTGRVSTVIAGATAVAASMVNVLAAGGAWAAVIGAATAAALAYWHPAGVAPEPSTAPAKA